MRRTEGPSQSPGRDAAESRKATHKWEINHSPPQEVRGLSLTRSPQPGDSATGRRAPRMSGFERQWGLHTGALESCRKQETLLLKGTCKISHIPRPRAEVVISKEPGSDPLAVIRESPKEAGNNWVSF